MRSSVITMSELLIGIRTAGSVCFCGVIIPKSFRTEDSSEICREIQKTVKEAMQLSVSIGIGSMCRKAGRSSKIL